jgi:pimeloyl-ACP methyl ester carboxylesterase
MKVIKWTLVMWACALSFSISGQEITGDWHGVLKVQGMQFRLVFHVQKTGEGYSATMDSPDQGASGIPATSASREEEVVKLSIAPAGIEYEGRLGADGKITGTFRQAGFSLPLTLSQQAVEKEAQAIERETPARPQEPVKPYPYREEEVFFEHQEGDGSTVRLAGTLALPRGKGPFPAVVLISGSGAQERDEEIAGHKVFLVLSDYLTRNGVAVLRFDDRGTGASTGDFQAATSLDFSRDAEAGVRFLQAREEIHEKKIGLVGHSEGGCIAPMVAARNKEVAFIVLLAGTGIRGDQVLLQQQELIAGASGVAEEDRRQTRVINEACFNEILRATDAGELASALTACLRQAREGMPGNAGEVYSDDFIKAAVARLTSPWMQYFIKHDPAAVLERVKCPVLAINGGKDLQVPAKVNLEAIRAALVKGGNKRVTVKELPGLNHLFQECDTGLPAEYGRIEQTFSPVALEVVLAWITARVKK